MSMTNHGIPPWTSLRVNTIWAIIQLRPLSQVTLDYVKLTVSQLGQLLVFNFFIYGRKKIVYLKFLKKKIKKIKRQLL